MAVPIKRRLNRGVTELALEELDMGALSNHQSGVRVAEVVKPNPAQASTGQRRPQLPLDQVLRINWAAVLLSYTRFKELPQA